MSPTTWRIEHALVAARTNRRHAWTALDDAAVTRYTQSRPDRGSPERPLEGAPCGIKDNVDVQGLPTASGSTYPAAASTRDAALVRTLRRAGAVIVGKNAMHEIAYGSTGMVSSTAPVDNPRAPGRMPGGSSSGSAAAVAAGDVPFAIGTDTGGSVRVPAALCGVVGLRPSVGRLDSAGVRPLSPTLDTPGVLAATVDVATTVWCAVSGMAPPAPDADAARRVGVVVDDYFATGSPAVHDAVRHAAELLAEHGCHVTAVRLGWVDTAVTVYSHILGPEAAWTHRERLSEPSPRLHPSTLQRLSAGSRQSGSSYVEALRQRDRIAADVLRPFDDYDVLICPTTPVTAPHCDQTTAHLGGLPVDVGRALISYTAPWSLTGAPALAVPLGCDAQGLPTSIQIVGAPGDEGSVLRTGSILERTRRRADSAPTETR